MTAATSQKGGGGSDYRRFAEEGGQRHARPRPGILFFCGVGCGTKGADAPPDAFRGRTKPESPGITAAKGMR